jgi:LAO/AO transport system kinase
VRARQSPEELKDGVTGGDRGALSRAITLAESSRADDQELAQDLIAELLPGTGEAIRLGITGVPGAGKSTAIEALGLQLIGQGHKVAVLVIDPTSARTGGSILGDKTRMNRLSAEEDAYIRPSPSGGVLGGVARKTREAMLLCEAAGFDVIIVESVGVGQSEAELAELVDCLMLLLVPGAGDDLQGIKKGVLEVADLIAVNKADIDIKAAKRAARAYEVALHIMEQADPDWAPPVHTVSGFSGEGLPELWAAIELHRKKTEASGSRAKRRAGQQVRWLDALIQDGLADGFAHRPQVAARLKAVRQGVADGRIPASTAADELLALFFGPI